VTPATVIDLDARRRQRRREQPACEACDHHGPDVAWAPAHLLYLCVTCLLRRRAA
jgi:hypothetical protein